ncbi:MAG: hypothetical protein OHK0039_30520 [Bacteroidia bacterium]
MSASRFVADANPPTFAPMLYERWQRWVASPLFLPLMLGAWLLLNLWQAFSTELFHDEAYYWFYARRLEWAYAEHPPMIALWIRLGTALLPGEAGVRLLPVLANTLALGLAQTLVPRAQRALFWLLLPGIFLAHVGGFFAAPDAPLAFFVVVFLVLYQRYLVRDSLWLALGLGGVAAAVLYSKYHGLMLLGCLLLAHLRLLRRASFWLLAGVALLLLVPLLHTLWAQGFATFTFHLSERIARPNDGSFTLNYILNQFLILGPLLGWVLLPTALLQRGPDPFARSLKWGVAGILGFLLLLSLRTWVEANWSAAAFIPILVLATGYLHERPRWRRWAVGLALPGWIIGLAFRLYAGLDVPPSYVPIRNEVHGWPAWARQIEAVAGDRPAVFFNSYQHPAKYSFYTGKPAFAFNNFLYHRSQYDAWCIEDSLRGQEAVFFLTIPGLGTDTLITTIDTFFYAPIHSLQGYGRVRIEPLSLPELRAGQPVALTLRLVNDYDHPLRFDQNPDLGVWITANYGQEGRWVHAQAFEPPLGGLVLADTALVEVQLIPPTRAGRYKLTFALRQGWIDGSINGRWQEIEALP